MKRLQSTAAHELATQVRAAIASHNVIEARLFTTYEVEELPHKATLALYSTHSTEDPSDNIFRSDDAVIEFDLTEFGYARTNKRFIKSMIHSLGLNWNRYLSQRVQLAWNIQGYQNTSARVNFAKVLAILP